MSIATTDLLRKLGELRLVAPSQAEQIAAEVQPRFPEARALAGELIRRGWLTPYQVNQLFAGRGGDLLLGNYVLLERLGEGGMGQVFKARNWKLGRVVALKLIRRERLANADAVRRFHREIQACGQVNHANIVHALDAEEADGHHFLVMEHVEGTDLGRLVKQRGPLPAALACDCARQAALALQHVHEQGLVHRDVKPSNLLRAHMDGTVKLLDLGLARFGQGLEEGGSTLTQLGSLMGTPDFMAPEQAEESHAVDIRADLYSLGCTLYFLLAGRVPFPGGTYAQKIRKHERAEPRPLEELRPDLAPEAAAVVRRLMAKRPDDRYATPAEAAAALAAVTTDSAPPAVPALQPAVLHDTEPPFAGLTPDTHRLSRRRRWPRGLIAGVLGLSVVGLLAALSFRGRKTESPTPETGGTPPAAEGPQAELDALRRRLGEQEEGARLQLALDLLAFRRRHGATPEAFQAAHLLARLPSPLNHLPPIPEAERFPAWQPHALVAVLGEHRQRHWDHLYCVAFHPDGKRVASGGDDHLIRLWDVETGREVATLRGHASRVAALAFSPDGKVLASGDGDRDVFLWDLERPGEPAVLRGPSRAVSSLAFSPDGRTLASGSHDKGICLWDVSPIGTRRRAAWDAHAAEVLAVAFSPDGLSLASGGNDKRVKLWDPATGQERRTLEGAGRAIVGVAFGAGGGIVLGLEEDGLLRRWDAATGRELGPPDPTHGSLVRSLAVAPDGLTAAVGESGDVVRLWDVTTGKPRATLPGRLITSYLVNGLAFSKDGQVLAMIGHQGCVCFWDLKRQRQRAPAFGGAWTGPLAAGPDGRTLAVGYSDGSLRLWDIPSGEVRVVGTTKSRNWVSSMAFRPDGKALAFVQDWKVWSVDLSGPECGPPREVASLEGGTVIQVAFSADGRLLAATTTAGRIGLWETDTWTARELPGGRVDRCRAVAFGPDGRSLALNVGQEVRWYRDVAGRDPPLVGKVNSAPPCLAFSPDGKTVAAGAHGEVFRWKAATGEALESLRGNRALVFSLAWSPDGRTLAAVDSYGQFTWWDAGTGKVLGRWQAPGGRVGLAVAFLPDSRHFAVSNANGTVYLLRLPLRAN
jgi:WD40 repeat protein/tRNA A-37 threonylcarbamoyl transferase component Bud32